MQQPKATESSKRIYYLRNQKSVAYNQYATLAIFGGKTLGEYVYMSNGEPMMNESGEISLARAQIVRCRDCECYHRFITYAGTPLDYGECMKHRRQTYDSRFCAWGERKEGGE